jgi:hypothetical protein
METISRSALPEHELAHAAPAPPPPPTDEALLHLPVSGSFPHAKHLLPLSSQRVSSADGPPKQPVSRSLFQRHSKFKKTQPVAASTASVSDTPLGLSAPPNAPTSDFSGIFSSVPAGPAVGDAAPTAADADDAAGNHAAVTAAGDDSVAAPAATASLGHLAAHQDPLPPDSQSRDVYAITCAIPEQQQLISRQQQSLESSSVDDGEAAPSAECDVSEATAVMLRMTESVGVVERRWMGSAGSEVTKDEQLDLKVLVLVEDQVGSVAFALFHCAAKCNFTFMSVAASAMTCTAAAALT